MIPPPTVSTTRHRYLATVLLGACVLLTIVALTPVLVHAWRNEIMWGPRAWACDGFLCQLLGFTGRFSRLAWVVAALFGLGAVKIAHSSRRTAILLILYLGVTGSYALGIRGGIDCVVFPDGRVDC
jgi:hypothetical protein